MDFYVPSDISIEEYKRLCQELPPLRGDHISQYDLLTLEEKTALGYWIRNSIEDAPRKDKYCSYGIKHDFEKEGFYVTDGQFCAAMIHASIWPVREHSNYRWEFYIKPMIKTSGFLTKSFRYSLGRFDKTYARLLAATGHR